MRLSRRHLLGAGGMTLASLALARTCTATSGLAQGAASNDMLGALSYHITEPGVTLLDLARQRNLGILEISAANPGVDVWVPGRERLIVLPTAHLLPETKRQGLVINLAELRLYYFHGDVVETHPIGVGREGFHTPVGGTTVVRKAADPTWRPTDSTRADKPWLPTSVPPGPENPLGAFALYLGWPTYLIHGTNKPYGVGRRVSRGCIRMYPEDIADLFEKVAPSTPVQVLTDPIKLGWSGGELYIEAHPDIEQLDELEETYRFTKKPPPPIRERLLEKAGDAASRIDWEIVTAELSERRGVPVRISRPSTAVAESGLHRDAPTVNRSFTGLY